MTLNDKFYVAKQFFDVGKGAEVVTVDDNASQLEAEIYRLKRGSWFWQWFKEAAHHRHCEIPTGK